MDQVKCERCGVTFDKNPKGLALYRTHRINHNLKITKKKAKKANVAEPLKPVTPKIPVVKQSKPWDKKKPSPLPTMIPKEKLKQVTGIKTNNKILLKYIWEGLCPKCQQPVNTIDLATGKTYVTVAYCVACKKKLRERAVTKL